MTLKKNHCQLLLMKRRKHHCIDYGINTKVGCQYQRKKRDRIWYLPSKYTFHLLQSRIKRSLKELLPYDSQSYLMFTVREFKLVATICAWSLSHEETGTNPRSPVVQTTKLGESKRWSGHTFPLIQRD